MGAAAHTLPTDGTVLFVSAFIALPVAVDVGMIRYRRCEGFNQCDDFSAPIAVITKAVAIYFVTGDHGSMFHLVIGISLELICVGSCALHFHPILLATAELMFGSEKPCAGLHVVPPRHSSIVNMFAVIVGQTVVRGIAIPGKRYHRVNIAARNRANAGDLHADLRIGFA